MSKIMARQMYKPIGMKLSGFWWKGVQKIKENGEICMKMVKWRWPTVGD